jgi:sugar phosphate isomerase/epimerase
VPAEAVRLGVLGHLAAMLDAARECGVSLVHENEKDIYGDTGDRCLDLATELPGLGLCFDFANFVQCGENTLQCWRKLKDRVVYFDVKDAVDGRVVPAGEGDGRVEEIFRDALARGFDDRFNLEPHLSSGGQFGGSTSPELFEVAVGALQRVLEKASA